MLTCVYSICSICFLLLNCHFLGIPIFRHTHFCSHRFSPQKCHLNPRILDSPPLARHLWAECEGSAGLLYMEQTEMAFFWPKGSQKTRKKHMVFHVFPGCESSGFPEILFQLSLISGFTNRVGVSHCTYTTTAVGQSWSSTSGPTGAQAWG